MGSLVSPIVANLYREYFERKALSTASTPPRHRFRFVDDTFVIQQENQKQNFLDHINKIDPAIKFTAGGNQENGTIPFLDTLVKPKADNSYYVFLCIENLLILTNTYSEIAIIILLLSIVWLVLLPTGQKLFTLDQGSWKMK